MAALGELAGRDRADGCRACTRRSPPSLAAASGGDTVVERHRRRGARATAVRETKLRARHRAVIVPYETLVVHVGRPAPRGAAGDNQREAARRSLEDDCRARGRASASGVALEVIPNDALARRRRSCAVSRATLELGRTPASASTSAMRTCSATSSTPSNRSRATLDHARARQPRAARRPPAALRRHHRLGARAARAAEGRLRRRADVRAGRRRRSGERRWPRARTPAAAWKRSWPSTATPETTMTTYIEHIAEHEGQTVTLAGGCTTAGRAARSTSSPSATAPASSRR